MSHSATPCPDCAEKDARIAELELRPNVGLHALTRLAADIYGERLNQVMSLFEKVPHFHTSYNPEDRMDIGPHQCDDNDCPRCQFEVLKLSWQLPK